MSEETRNLDQLCAKAGYEMAKAVYDFLKEQADNYLTKSLGVLQENGLYAFFLFQASRGKREKDGAKALQDKAQKLLHMIGIKGFETTEDPLIGYQDLATDLDQLLLAKRLLEQALIYARYHAKALEE
jgi:hypothetical protein